VPWLRICGDATNSAGLRQETVFLPDGWISHHFGKRRHGADLDAAGGIANSAELRDAAQVDDHLGFLDAVLEPVEAVEASGHDPGIGSMLREELLRVSGGGGLEQLKSGMTSRITAMVSSQMCAISGCCIGRPLRATLDRVKVDRRSLEDLVAESV